MSKQQIEAGILKGEDRCIEQLKSKLPIAVAQIPLCFLELLEGAISKRHCPIQRKLFPVVLPEQTRTAPKLKHPAPRFLFQLAKDPPRPVYWRISHALKKLKAHADTAHFPIRFIQ
ncbi:MAG TPA: hypothetical protein VF458_08275 [Ktedonobacteraceae bacterium]